MEIPPETLSASALRNLLIEEVKSFVESIDKAPESELLQKRARLIAIYKAITEKEKAEISPLRSE